MIVTRTRDKKTLAKILNHPKVTDYLRDDFSADGHYTPYVAEMIIYLIDPAKTGVTRFEPMNGACCQAHIATLPAMWGNASDFAKSCIEWIFKHTRYQKIVGMVPAYNTHTLNLVNKIGMRQEGLITKSFLKDFVLNDLHIYAIGKYETNNDEGE